MNTMHLEEWGKPTDEEIEWELEHGGDDEPVFTSKATLKHSGFSDWRIKIFYDELIEDLDEDGKKLIHDACGLNPTAREMRIALAMAQILKPVPPIPEPFASMDICDCIKHLEDQATSQEPVFIPKICDIYAVR